jgi:hypothetical protein
VEHCILLVFKTVSIKNKLSSLEHEINSPHECIKFLLGLERIEQTTIFHDQLCVARYDKLVSKKAPHIHVTWSKMFPKI